MAKQKSGLGRGLNALFDDSPAYTQKPSAPEAPKEQERRVPEPLSEEPAQKKQESAGVLHQALRERTAKRSSGKPADPSSDIYISEDAQARYACWFRYFHLSWLGVYENSCS